MDQGITLFDVCVWYRTACYLRAFPNSNEARMAALSAPYAPPSAKAVWEALHGKYGKLVVHSHVWDTLCHQLSVNPDSGVAANEAKYFVHIFKSYVTHTGGDPDVAWTDDKNVGDSLIVRHGVPDFEDARVVMGALAAHASRIITHDWDFAADSKVAGLEIRYMDPLTAAQRATRNLEKQQAARRRRFEAA